MTPTSAHPLFLTNLNDQLERYSADGSLDVHQLTRLVGMSRTDLHRKLSQTTGMSTTEYLRYFRLKKAAQLLVHQKSWSISQVAQQVGFNHPCYFSKRFKEMFGMSPREWRTTKRYPVQTPLYKNPNENNSKKPKPFRLQGAPSYPKSVVLKTYTSQKEQIQF